MGTHPIFESDFDCLTEHSANDKMSNIEVKLDTESAQPVPVVAPAQPPPPSAHSDAGAGEAVEVPKPIVPDEPLPARVEPIQPSGNTAMAPDSDNIIGGGQGVVGGENPLKSMKLPDNMIPTTENLDKLKRWGLKHYRVNRQRVQEMMGTATITTEPDLEPRVEKLQIQLIKYKELHMLGEELANRFNSLTLTQKKMGDFFQEMSLKSKDLQEEFSYNAETQKALFKNGSTLNQCLSSFNQALHTLIFRTMEDTLMTLKEYERARIEFDAYRTDLEKMQMMSGPSEPPGHQQKLDEAMKSFKLRKEKLDKLKDSLIIKMKLLDENRHKVMAKQLLLLHNGVSSYFAGNQQALEGSINQFNMVQKKSFLEQ